MRIVDVVLRANDGPLAAEIRLSVRRHVALYCAEQPNCDDRGSIVVIHNVLSVRRPGPGFEVARKPVYWQKFFPYSPSAKRTWQRSASMVSGRSRTIKQTSLKRSLCYASAQTRAAASTTSPSLRHCSSSVSRLPSSVDAKPH